MPSVLARSPRARPALFAALALTGACALPHAPLRARPGQPDAEEPALDAEEPPFDAATPAMDAAPVDRAPPPVDRAPPPSDQTPPPADAPVDRPVIPADTNPCGPGTTLCAGRCVNTLSDANHCGRCDNRCPVPTSGAAACSGGMCAGACPVGQRLCGDACKTNDVDACGPTCVRCVAPTGGTVTCNGSACVPACPAGMMVSGAACTNIVSASCGNSVLDMGEGCDDGNRAPDDGCNAACMVESGVFRDQCSSDATGVSVRRGQAVWLRGTTVGRAGDGTGMCGLTGPDVVLRVRAVDGGDLTVTATPLTHWDLGLRAGGRCPGDTCIDRLHPPGPEVFAVRVSGGTDVDVVVDGFGGAAGPFSVQITLR